MINRNVVLMELKRNFKSLLVWSVSVGLSMFVILISYPLVEDMFDQLPAEFLEIMSMFGGIPSNLIEYFAMEGGMIYQLTCALYATLLGFTTITKEEREKSTDFIYPLPVARKTFFNSKLLAMIMQVTLFVVATMIFIILGVIVINDYESFGRLLIYGLLTWVMLIILMAFAVLLGTLIKKNIKQLTSIIIPLPLYIISVIASISHNQWVKNIKYLTPYTFSDPLVVLKGDTAFEWVTFLVFSLLAVISYILAYRYFTKKEFLY